MLDKVKEIIEEKLSLDGVEITEETRFKEDLDADSLDLFDMVMEFEDEFGIEISSEDLEKLSSVGDVIEFIQSKQA
ncbi:MAG: acyl carrier protein [Lachnospiraceae bacterium]|nr:acyl carrier protein [Lachnospiraceae bacterium]